MNDPQTNRNMIWRSLASRGHALENAVMRDEGLKTHCKRGHEFTEENTRLDGKGYRVCRKCDRGYKRKARKG